MSISWLWSRALLLNRSFLWLLFAVNAAGTVYGYMWYGDQLAETAANHPLWRLVFVPDSPTASLFFTLSLLFLLYPPGRDNRLLNLLRAFVEAFAVLTLIKYGVWAVGINFAQQAQGSPLDWQNWMLIVSHASMAVEGLLYIRFMIFGRAAACVILGWLLLNDTVDYTFDVYPWLPGVLEPHVTAVRNLTVLLSLISFLVSLLALSLVQRGRKA
ncbi:DUF1405 domain-containing protein [Paenibacillus tarimensis]|uniref:DUF1405 domain-containing protein n=1 Tax=Paenibacillus tarimensis TaxID=416012 RepID=UPI001F318F35|nr:DUF1405 domain-containing protein [Paenibacillus tarimensis]MCF2942572.1 DUF1405 domain-containing protein [Paenibacillus tarimensis]